MTITELSRILGNFGEFVGAIAVVAYAGPSRHPSQAQQGGDGGE